MDNPLQDRRTATEWASGKQVIEIAEKISSFKGLEEILVDDLSALEADKMPTNWGGSAVTGRIQFGFTNDEPRIPIVTGSVTTQAHAVCQRCLQPFRLGLQIEPQLLLLRPNETVAGREEFEVWELDQQTLRPLDIVEELLIMAMPFSARHDNMAECTALSPQYDRADEVAAEKIKRPFAELRSQMQQIGKDPD